MDYLPDFDNADTLSIDTLALEEIIQEERAKENAELNRLSKKVCYLHTSLLYYRNTKSKIGNACYEAWRRLIRKVGGSPDCWRAFGHHLGISAEDLDYIKNTVKEDPTDTILKMFLQEDTATLDKIIDAFVKMKRYDILKCVQEPLCDMAQYFNKDDAKCDTGYHSGSRNSGQKEIISFSKYIPHDLPPALNKKFVNNQKGPNRPNQGLRNQFQKIEKITNDKPILFLTFAEDGYETALNLQEKVNSWPEEYAVTIIMLNERKDEVLPNPEKSIRDFFEKANYIVPIVTTGYFEKIKSHNLVVCNTADNLDFKYVGFIYTLIVNHYIHVLGCFNEKVRSVLPENADVSVLSTITMYPDLVPWTHESSFDEQFQEFLKDLLEKENSI